MINDIIHISWYRKLFICIKNILYTILPPDDIIHISWYRKLFICTKNILNTTLPPTQSKINGTENCLYVLDILKHNFATNTVRWTWLLYFKNTSNRTSIQTLDLKFATVLTPSYCQDAFNYCIPSSFQFTRNLRNSFTCTYIQPLSDFSDTLRKHWELETCM